MNIAVACGRTINLTTGASKTTQIDEVIYKLLAERGHRLTFYTPVDKIAVDRKFNLNLFDEQHWVQAENVRFKFRNDLDDDEDVLYVQATMFSNIEYSHHIERLYKIVQQWDGAIVYNQNDHGKEFMFMTKLGHFMSLPSKQHLNIEDEEVVFKNIDKIVVLVNSKKVDRFKTLRSSCSDYSLDVFEFKFFNTLMFIMNVLEKLEPISRVYEDLVYIGNFRNGKRLHGFRRLLEPLDRKTHVFGRGWVENSSKAKLKDNIVLNDSLKFSRVQQMYNKYMATVQLYDQDALGLSSYTLRTYEAVMSGCLLFADREIYASDADFELDKYFLVSTADELQRKLNESVKDRRQLVLQQQSKLLKLYDEDVLVTELEDILWEAKR